MTEPVFREPARRATVVHRIMTDVSLNDSQKALLVGATFDVDQYRDALRSVLRRAQSALDGLDRGEVPNGSLFQTEASTAERYGARLALTQQTAKILDVDDARVASVLSQGRR